MQEQRKPTKHLTIYLLWPFIAVILLLAAAVWLFMHAERTAGLIFAAAALIDLIISLILFLSAKKAVDREALRFFNEYETQQLKILNELDTPLAFALKDGRILWMNQEFKSYLDPEDLKDPTVRTITPEMTPKRLPSEKDDSITVDYEYAGRVGEATFRMLPVSDLENMQDLMHVKDQIDSFITMTLTDLTDLHQAQKENDDKMLAAGMIYIDNYDELMEMIEEIRQSLVVALIEQEINQYVIDHNGLIKKTENDKFFFAVRKCDLAEMEQDKFKLLEAVKEIDTGSGHKPTLSIGIGIDKKSYTQSSDNARSAISLALARGGDQAVIKNGDQLSYYGAKGEQPSKNTRVKARVKAHDLSELIMQKESIYIMGHKLADADSLGAALGIYKIAATLERKAHIVIGTVTANLRPLYLAFKDDPFYPKDLFVSPEEAIGSATADSMVVVVDTNIPERVECEKLLDICKTIVVFDHHRQTAVSIKNPTLSYIEPYASSACEMVTEVIQYTEANIKLTEQEANALYAGIVIDTNNFLNRTGVRTFEAASVLRRAGANITYVRKIFRDALEDYKEKAVIISRAEVYKDRFAITTYDGEHSQSPTILGAQAANELLNIDGIQASFVLTRFGNKIYVSARSIDEVNVQVMMEKLGGGGHINIAGTQFAHTNLEKAKNAIKSTIDQMIESGNL